jgi:transposase
MLDIGKRKERANVYCYPWVDLGKSSCSIVGVDAAGAVIIRRTMRRQTLIDYVTKFPACVVAMEACCGAHHLGRLFAEQGHEIR